jgi:thymidylate synthase (FAD)
MKIVPQSATWEQEPPEGFEVLAAIERAGRTCYKSEAKWTPESCHEFVRGLLKLGHESVLEHISLSVRIICDRGVSHEIVRHRLASYSQESTRYCNYGKNTGDIQVIMPPGLNQLMEASWFMAMDSAEAAYLNLLKEGASPQIARSVLPTCLKTELVMTANLREWRHFFKLRTAPAAHPQMQDVAQKILCLFQAHIPIIFDEFLEGACHKS